MAFGDWIGGGRVTGDLAVKLQKAGRNRVVVSHAVGAADDGGCALVKVALFGGASEVHVLPAGLAYWLIDRIGEAVEAGALQDLRDAAEPGSPPAQQLALHAAARPEIADADWQAADRIAAEIHAHAFGNALGLMTVRDGIEALLILPDQVAILLHESLTLAATYLIDRVHPAVSRSAH
jgi:hypothetical protein